MVIGKNSAVVKESSGDKIFIASIYVILSVILVTVLYPLIYVVSSSFSSAAAITSGQVKLLPVDPSLAGYRAVFSNDQVVTGYMNTFIVTGFGTLINVFMTVLAGYPLSRKEFVGRNIIMMLFTFTMIFNGGLIPTYLVVKACGLLDTRWALILPYAMGVYQVIIARTFFQSTIPDELAEAADMDGCSDVYFVWKVVLPLSKPIIAVLVLMYAVGHWNSFFPALIYLKSNRLFPLQMILRNILIQNQFDVNSITSVRDMIARQGMKDLLKYSLIVVGSGPVLILYPFVQKYFVQGVMIGSLKG